MDLAKKFNYVKEELLAKTKEVYYDILGKKDDNEISKRMSQERRLSKRETLIELVQYIPYPLTSNNFLAALMQNYNSTGLCVITSVPLEEGNVILLKGKIAPNARTAVVRWHQQVANSAFKIGLEFKQ